MVEQLEEKIFCIGKLKVQSETVKKWWKVTAACRAS